MYIKYLVVDVQSLHTIVKTSFLLGNDKLPCGILAQFESSWLIR